MHGFHDRDVDMATTAIRLARGKVAPRMARGRTSIDGDGAYLRWTLFRKRLEYQRVIEWTLRRSGAIDVGVLGEEVYTEYVPYIRDMVSQVLEMGEGEGRTTRNSTKTKSWEVVTLLGWDARKTIAATGLQGG